MASENELSENELQWIFHIEVLVIYIYILSVSLPQGVLQNPHLWASSKPAGSTGYKNLQTSQ